MISKFGTLLLFRTNFAETSLKNIILIKGVKIIYPKKIDANLKQNHRHSS